MSRSKFLAKRALQQTSVKMEAKGFAETMNWLATSFRNVRPGVHEQEINQLIEIFIEINGGPFHPIQPIVRIESIENMIGSAMPGLIRSVGQAYPTLSLRLLSIDWRLVFGIPIPPIDFNVNAPSDDDSGTGTISASTEIETNDDSPKNGQNPPLGPSPAT